MRRSHTSYSFSSFLVFSTGLTIPFRHRPPRRRRLSTTPFSSERPSKRPGGPGRRSRAGGHAPATAGAHAERRGSRQEAGRHRACGHRHPHGAARLPAGGRAAQGPRPPVATRSDAAPIRPPPPLPRRQPLSPPPPPPHLPVPLLSLLAWPKQGPTVAGDGCSRAGAATVVGGRGSAEGAREGRKRAGGPDGESDSLWRFAERTSGDDEPDAVASRLQNLLEAVFTVIRFFSRANSGYRVFWRCPYP
ncbi:hypothetical protein PVAP13_4NG118019 [Panicum virgatum]|uniref:Uncharacterized protein n=1 Tax=Panicum virgatum TaxID=38727 RepID=A0A8T0T7H9_PANVG|nr:hypothetical protein PVAP13_4NG118019 [Panicum virgatum]